MVGNYPNHFSIIPRVGLKVGEVGVHKDGVILKAGVKPRDGDGTMRIKDGVNNLKDGSRTIPDG